MKQPPVSPARSPRLARALTSDDPVSAAARASLSARGRAREQQLVTAWANELKADVDWLWRALAAADCHLTPGDHWRLTILSAGSLTAAQTSIERLLVRLDDWRSVLDLVRRGLDLGARRRFRGRVSLTIRCKRGHVLALVYPTSMIWHVHLQNLGQILAGPQNRLALLAPRLLGVRLHRPGGDVLGEDRR